MTALAALVACRPAHIGLTRATEPTLADSRQMRLVAVGDTGRGNPTQQRVARAIRRTCRERGCDLVLLLGDNLYPAGMESADDSRADAWIRDPYVEAAPVYAVLGNHDWANRDAQRAQWQIDWAASAEGVELPAHAWWTSAGPVTLVALDTNAALQFGAEPQAEWATGILDRADTPWTLVLGHHPYRSDGPHGNAGSYEGLPGVPWWSGGSVAELLDQALCGRADLYLSGHDHSRQLLEACGTTLIVSGAGGAVTERVDRGNHPTFARSTPGFAWIELREEGGEVRYFDEEATEEAVFLLRSTSAP